MHPGSRVKVKKGINDPELKRSSMKQMAGVVVHAEDPPGPDGRLITVEFSWEELRKLSPRAIEYHGLVEGRPSLWDLLEESLELAP